MTALKLARLADRTPVRLVIHVSPELNRVLGDYARAYKEVYGSEEPVEALVPAMLASFLDSDRDFARRQRREQGR